MGCTISENIYRDEPRLQLWKTNFNDLNLSREEISDFYRIFLKFCKDNYEDKNKCQIASILTYLDFDSNQFIKLILSLFKHDDSSETLDDLREFIFSIWNFGTLDEISLAKYAFLLYHNSNEKVLTPKQLTELTKDAYGYNYENNALATKMLAVVSKKALSVDEFIEFVKSHPHQLYPITSIQMKLQTKIFGKAVWERFKQYRQSLSESELVRIFQRVNSAIDFSLILDTNYRRDTLAIPRKSLLLAGQSSQTVTGSHSSSAYGFQRRKSSRDSQAIVTNDPVSRRSSFSSAGSDVDNAEFLSQLPTVQEAPRGSLNSSTFAGSKRPSLSSSPGATQTPSQAAASAYARRGSRSRSRSFEDDSAELSSTGSEGSAAPAGTGAIDSRDKARKRSVPALDRIVENRELSGLEPIVATTNDNAAAALPRRRRAGSTGGAGAISVSLRPSFDFAQRIRERANDAAGGRRRTYAADGDSGPSGDLLDIRRKVAENVMRQSQIAPVRGSIRGQQESRSMAMAQEALMMNTDTGDEKSDGEGEKGGNKRGSASGAFAAKRREVALMRLREGGNHSSEAAAAAQKAARRVSEPYAPLASDIGGIIGGPGRQAVALSTPLRRVSAITQGTVTTSAHYVQSEGQAARRASRDRDWASPQEGSEQSPAQRRLSRASRDRGNGGGGGGGLVSPGTEVVRRVSVSSELLERVRESGRARGQVADVARPLTGTAARMEAKREFDLKLQTVQMELRSGHPPRRRSFA